MIGCVGTNMTEGLEIALMSMTRGERAHFSVKHMFAYGEKGNEELKVPPFSRLNYEITLFDFTMEEIYKMDKFTKKKMDLKEKFMVMIFLHKENIIKLSKSTTDVLHLLTVKRSTKKNFAFLVI